MKLFSLLNFVLLEERDSKVFNCLLRFVFDTYLTLYKSVLFNTVAT